MKEQPRTVLLVEDDPNDQLLIARVANRIGGDSFVRIVPDVHSAMSYMLGQGEYGDRMRFPFPDYIITDMKFPAAHGLDLLAQLKSTSGCDTVPVIVLSSSGSPRDVAEAYRLNAAAYFLKPNGLGALETLLRDIMAYWNHATTPRCGDVAA